MSSAVWKALMYKSFSIFRTRYIVTIGEIIWPCLLLLLVAEIRNLGAHEGPGPPTTEPLPEHLRGLDPGATTPSVNWNKTTRDSLNKVDNNLHVTTEAYFSDTTFRQKFLEKDPVVKGNRIKRQVDEDYPDHQGTGMPKEVCTINYGFVVILCFMSAWSGSGSLSHAERMSGTVERMRMYGVSDMVIVFSYILHSGLKQLVSSVLCTFLLKIRIGGPPLLENIDPFSTFVGLFLLNLHSTVYYLTIASFFDSSILRSIVGNASYMYLFLWAVRQNFSVAAQVFGNMFPPFTTVITMGTTCGFVDIGGVTAKSLISTTTGVNDLPLLLVPLLMLIGSAILLTILYYMLNVKPGPYGSAKPFYYIIPPCIKDKFLFKAPKFLETKNEDTNYREGLYEKAAGNFEVGIKIANLFKQYGNITSVKNLSLEIYAGQITALLGHNGAGKTTTLSILSGMLSPTSGSAVYHGFNIFENLGRFRKDLGLCPQSNLLHPNLKVIDQLIFFGMLHGLTKKEATESANRLLKVVGIHEKSNVVVKALSGGMQRKLCIALALLGNPRVVILDEPTSGVDPESRREIWNVLLEARGERIMIITTHFMEEADALGDQIAIMNHGEIVCYGSPMFLKKHYGAGYHVTVSCKPENFDRVIHTVTTKIPETTVIGENEDWIKFKLPFQKAELFPDLFRSFESDKEISRIGISCTTMEDVYLKVEEEAGGEISAVPRSSYERVKQTGEKTSCMTYINRFFALIIKSMLCTRRRWIITFLLVIVMPIIAAYIAIDNYNTKFEVYHYNDTNESEVVDLTTTDAKGMSYQGGTNNSTAGKGLHKSGDGDKQLLNNLIESLMKQCEADPFIFIRVYVFTFWTSMVAFIVSLTFAPVVHNERISSVKHLILMTGLSPITYWLSVLLWDAIVYLGYVLVTWITFIILDPNGLFERGSGVYILFLILLLSGLSMITSVYLITHLFKTLRAVVLFYSAGVFTFGFISYFLVPIKVAQPYIKILQLLPLTSSMLAIGNFMTLSSKKYGCRQCPYPGCEVILKQSYFKDDLGNDLIFLTGDFIFYMVLVILTDYGFFPYIWDKITSLFVGRIDYKILKEVDSDVAREKDRVDAAHNSTDLSKEPIAIIDGLAKKYSSSMVAVYDVTFGVSKGECFGLLGVNGAGKSTTFNMLTGMLYPTGGNVFLKGNSLNKNKSKCLSLIGYCPQHSALIESLTGRQMLTLFAKLRLIPPHDIDKEVDKWISLFGLDEYRDRPCGTYSGGNQRKLNTALAFIGDPSIILLDEPTTGVDPFIRRNLWNVIHACGNSNQAIIISSHSMDECEAVCDRLTIMVRGRMECIGDTQHLKSIYGTGFVIMIRLKEHTEHELAALKSRMDTNFSNEIELKDEHQVLLHYHLGSTEYLRSQLFSIMESVKKEFSLVEDYIITDSSLEEVFLSFAKKQNK